jgi:hypothetical protein
MWSETNWSLPGTSSVWMCMELDWYSLPLEKSPFINQTCPLNILSAKDIKPRRYKDQWGTVWSLQCCRKDKDVHYWNRIKSLKVDPPTSN